MSRTGRVLASLLQRSFSHVTPQQPLALIAAAQLGPAQFAFGPTRRITCSAPPMSSALKAALAQEISHETKEYATADIVASGPPSPFKLQEESGNTLLTLTRDFEGEKVSVDLQIMEQPEPDDYTEEGEEEDALAVNRIAFNVAVSRGASQLVFECESDGEAVNIMHVSHEKVGTPPSDSDFSGPVFEELDEDLIREFRAYLAARGIDRDLGEYLRHLVHDKEQREYAAWLQRVHDFVAKK